MSTNQILQIKIDLLDDILTSISEHKLTNANQVVSIIHAAINTLEEFKDSSLETCMECGGAYYMNQLDDDMKCSICASETANKEHWMECNGCLGKFDSTDLDCLCKACAYEFDAKLDALTSEL